MAAGRSALQRGSSTQAVQRQQARLSPSADLESSHQPSSQRRLALHRSSVLIAQIGRPRFPPRRRRHSAHASSPGPLSSASNRFVTLSLNVLGSSPMKCLLPGFAGPGTFTRSKELGELKAPDEAGWAAPVLSILVSEEAAWPAAWTAARSEVNRGRGSNRANVPSQDRGLCRCSTEDFTLRNPTWTPSMSLAALRSHCPPAIAVSAGTAITGMATSAVTTIACMRRHVVEPEVGSTAPSATYTISPGENGTGAAPLEDDANMIVHV